MFSKQAQSEMHGEAKRMDGWMDGSMDIGTDGQMD